MPRNDQMIRQWRLIQHLEGASRGATRQELAASLPADYARHLRTIRHDLDALEASGFPLLTEKVDSRGVVWKLMDGFRNIPPSPSPRPS